jgi:hypothetical protein
MPRATRAARPSPPSRGARGVVSSAKAQKRAASAEKSERNDALEKLKAFEKAAVSMQRGDAWQNVMTGLGIPGRDWTRSNEIVSDDALSRQQLDDLYAQDNLAAKIVDTIAEDAIRNWFEIVGVSGEAEGDFQRQIFTEFKRLRVKQRFLQWLKMGRKDGGGLLLIGADDGQTLDKPLNFDGVREIRHIHFVERWLTLPDTIDVDPMSDNFGEPLFYLLLPHGVQTSIMGNNEPLRRGVQPTTSEMIRVHHSRVVAYGGVQVSERRKQLFRGWGYSHLQRCYWSIQNYRVLWAHLSTIFKHLSQTVVKFAGYAELAAGDFQKAIKARLQTLQMARSTLSIVPLDKEDDIEDQTLHGLSGALEIIQYAQEELAQAADMPLTKLFGHMPQGFSKDDAAGRDNWNAKVHGVQEDHLLEPLTDLIELVARASRIAPPADWGVQFLPVNVPDGTEAADIDLKEAQADDLRIKQGSIDPEEARNSLRVDPRCRYLLKEGPAKGDDLVRKAAEKPAAAPNQIAEKAPKSAGEET